jgi:hypothetical protein
MDSIKRLEILKKRLQFFVSAPEEKQDLYKICMLKNKIFDLETEIKKTEDYHE